MKARILSALSVFFIFLSGCTASHKQFLYVVGNGTNEIFEFQQHGNGSLTPLAAPNVPTGSNPSSVAIHPPGDFIYIANAGGNDILLLDINRGNGELLTPPTNSALPPITPPNIFAVPGVEPKAIAISPTGPFLFTANHTSGDVSSFVLDPSNGNLGSPNAVSAVPISVPPAPPVPPVHPLALAVSPQGNFLYTANPAESSVSAFSIDSKGNLALIAGAPFSTGAGTSPSSVTFDSSGRFLYVTDSANNVVLGFSVQSNGTLSPLNGSPFPAGAAPSAAATDPHGVFLFVANAASNSVSVFVVDSGSGALGAVSGSPFATGGRGPSFVTVDPTGNFVYVADQLTNDVAVFALNGNGSLTPIAGSPINVPTSPVWISIAKE